MRQVHKAGYRKFNDHMTRRIHISITQLDSVLKTYSLYEEIRDLFSKHTSASSKPI